MLMTRLIKFNQKLYNNMLFDMSTQESDPISKSMLALTIPVWNYKKNMLKIQNLS